MFQRGLTWMSAALGAIAWLWLKEPAMLSHSATDPWVIAACLRGADCSAQAIWVRRWCRSDPACHPSETGLDLLRRNRGVEYEERERRAREIIALIDAKRLSELEFD